MKEELYTIPVNEALEQDGECLFCTLNKKLENDILDYILGPSYMEEDIRGETDKLGFCKKHYAQMFGAQNRLGVALMIDTHLKNVRENLKGFLEEDMNCLLYTSLFNNTINIVQKSDAIKENLDERYEKTKHELEEQRAAVQAKFNELKSRKPLTARRIFAAFPDLSALEKNITMIKNARLEKRTSEEKEKNNAED